MQYLLLKNNNLFIYLILLLINSLIPFHTLIAGDLVTRINLDSENNQAIGGGSDRASISANGKYVAFDSNSSDLIDNDNNGFRDVFLRDIENGKTIRVSVGKDEIEANSLNGYPSISADAIFIAFESLATNLTDNDNLGNSDIFVRDLTPDNNQTILVSVGYEEAQSDEGSYKASISSSGQLIAFESNSTNLIEIDNNNVQDIFVRDIIDKKTTLVSVDNDGNQANDHSFSPYISKNGDYVVFASAADNLTAEEAQRNNIYLRDLSENTTTRITFAFDGQDTDHDSGVPSISDDGRFVAFSSVADNLIDGVDTSGVHVFVHDRLMNKNILVSKNYTNSNEGGNGLSNFPTISADGRFVTFTSFADNLVPNDTNEERDVFVYDLATDQNIRISVKNDNEQEMNNNSGTERPSITATGDYIAFNSAVTNLVENDTNNARDIFSTWNSFTSPLFSDGFESN